MKTKFILLIISTIFVNSFTFSQEVNKFRAKSGAYKILNENGEWGEWSDWEETNSLITYNLENQRITIYGEPNRTFDIIDKKEETNNEGDKIFTMNCLGHNEMKCVFRIIIEQDGDIQFYIYYDEAALVYNVKILE